MWHFCGLKIKLGVLDIVRWKLRGDIWRLQLFQLLAICSPLWWMNWLRVCVTPPSSLLCPCSLCILVEDDPFIQFLSSPPLTRPPLLYLRASNVSPLETNARFSVFIYTDFPSPDISDVHCNPSSSSSPSSYPNLLQPPKSISCNH